MVFFNTPEFWYKDPGLLRKLCLKPISEIYRAVSSYRYHLPCDVSLHEKKVIAVGGITAGGSGKTVVVSSICKMLKENNKKFANYLQISKNNRTFVAVFPVKRILNE